MFAASPLEAPETTPATIDAFSAKSEDDEVDDLPDEATTTGNVQATCATAADDDSERWEGTMAQQWNEPASEESRPHRSGSPAAKSKAPRTSIEEALPKIPAEVRDYMREKLKSDFHLIRAYEPGLAAKDRVATKQKILDDTDDFIPDETDDMN